MNSALQEKNIFSIPVGKDFNFSSDESVYLVYSPLASKSLLMTPSEVTALENAASSNEDNSLLATLSNYLYPWEKQGYHASYRDCTTLYILPNQRCNFHCSYCYSSQGRSDAELSFEQLRTMLDYFFSMERCPEKKRSIMFIGGGEPLLSWDILVQGVHYAEKMAAENTNDLYLTVTSNASLFNNEMITFFKEHRISLKCSFDILPELQNTQRQNYELVASNLQAVLEAGISTEIQATITPKAIDLMPDMVRHVISHFPKVKTVILGCIWSTSVLEDTQKASDYFDHLYKSFIEAREIAEKHGLFIFNTLVNAVSIVRDRYCGGILVLTPEGRISPCVYVSSPKDKGYEQQVFGCLKNGFIEIDEQKIATFWAHKAANRPQCSNCFARWNCGGGCPNTAIYYTDAIQKVICEKMRLFLKRELLHKLSSSFFKNHGTTLTEHLHNALRGKND